MRRNLLCAAIISTLLTPAFPAQEVLKIQGVTFRGYDLEEFVKAAQSESAALKGKRLAVESVRASVDTMALPNLNPSVTYSRGAYYGSVPYSNFTSQPSNTVSASFTIEGAGKRLARKGLAEAELRRNEAELELFRRNLEGEALTLFIDALRLKKIWVALDKEIGKLSRLDAGAGRDALNESRRLQDSLGKDIRYLSYAMVAFLPEGHRDVPEPLGGLAVETRELDAETLVQGALASRADLSLVENTLKSASANLQMVEKGHNIDVTPGVWYSRTPAYTTYEKTTAYGFSLTIPISTHSLYRSDVIAAANYRTQVEYNLSESRKRARMEIQQAHTQYANAKEQLATATNAYRDATKAGNNDAAAIVAERQKEVDVIDARTNHLKALVNLLRLSGEYTLPKLPAKDEP